MIRCDVWCDGECHKKPHNRITGLITGKETVNALIYTQVTLPKSLKPRRSWKITLVRRRPQTKNAKVKSTHYPRIEFKVIQTISNNESSTKFCGWFDLFSSSFLFFCFCFDFASAEKKKSLQDENMMLENTNKNMMQIVDHLNSKWSKMLMNDLVYFCAFVSLYFSYSKNVISSMGKVKIS